MFNPCAKADSCKCLCFRNPIFQTQDPEDFHKNSTSPFENRSLAPKLSDIRNLLLVAHVFYPEVAKRCVNVMSSG